MTRFHRLSASAVLVAMAGIAGMLLGALVMPSPVARAQSSQPALVGSWLVTLNNVQLTLATYNSDGTVIVGSSNALVSTAHGAWAAMPDGQFAVTLLVFRRDPTGMFAGSTRTLVTLRVGADGNTFGGGGAGQLLAPSGDQVGTQDIALTGTRIALQQAGSSPRSQPNDILGIPVPQ